MQEFIYRDQSEERWDDILANHNEEARQRAFSLIADGIKTDTGCIVTDTEAIRKVRFRSHQHNAYRFIYCALNEVWLSYDEVVRHRCNTRRCINPDHLEVGSREDNSRDDRDFQANGVDFDYL